MFGKKFGPAPGSATALDPAAMDRAVLSSSGVLLQSLGEHGAWRLGQKFYPREHWDEALFDNPEPGRSRLVFVGQHKLQFVGRLVPSLTGPPVLELDLVAARHSRLGNVRQAIAEMGGALTSLNPGDTLVMEFPAPPLAEGLVREWFLVTRGVYSAKPTDGPIAESAGPPRRFHLAQNRPNPFARTTTIRFELPMPTELRLEVFDLVGRRVRTLAEGSHSAGFHAVEWDRRDANGATVGPGVYLYRLTAGTFRAQKKMAILP